MLVASSRHSVLVASSRHSVLIVSIMVIESLLDSVVKFCHVCINLVHNKLYGLLFVPVIAIGDGSYPSQVLFINVS